MEVTIPGTLQAPLRKLYAPIVGFLPAEATAGDLVEYDGEIYIRIPEGWIKWRH